MKIVISPAKSLDYKSKLPTTRATQPQFIREAAQVNNELKKVSPTGLSKLMGISPKLADLNYRRNQEFHTPFTKKNARPAVYAYSGDVYVGLDAYSIPVSQLNQLQKMLRILSGLYGLLKPLDLIQPYRLEMGIKLCIGEKKNLYDFWKEKLTAKINRELKNDDILLNLASNEYSKALDSKHLKVPMISPVFKDFKNGKLKIISFYAKKARGSMVRYILDKEVKDFDGVLGFDYGGYSYNEKETKEENKPVFVRDF